MVKQQQPVYYVKGYRIENAVWHIGQSAWLVDQSGQFSQHVYIH